MSEPARGGAPRRLQVYESAAITVTFDPTRCFHSGVCVRTLPAVFDTARRRWIRPENGDVDAVAAIVERCPSGALRYVRADGKHEEVPAECSVRPMRHGPLLVRGAVRLTRADGSVIAEDHRVALCRCGGSANPPFCDGTHVRNRFRDPEPADAAPRPGDAPSS